MEEVYDMDWKQYFQLVSTIYSAPRFSAAMKSIQNIYPLTNNDYILAVLISQNTGLPVSNTMDAHSVIVSNIADTGTTINKHKKNPKVVLISRCKINTLNYYTTSNKYVRFPWEREITSDLEDKIRQIIGMVGGNTKQISHIPERMCSMFQTLFEGYDMRFKTRKTVIKNRSAISGKYGFFSIDDESGCPFYGTVHIAYYPSKHAIENMEDVVNYHAHRFTNPNKMVKDISNTIYQKISPKGIIVKVTGINSYKKYLRERAKVSAMETKGKHTGLWKVM